MDTIKDYARLLHIPTLLLIAAFQVLMYFFVIVPSTKSLGVMPSMPILDLINLIGATVFMAAGGFVINDYFDLKIDQINRPLTRIVGRTMDKHTAMTLYIVLTVIGIVFALLLCWHARSIDYAIMLLFISGILWFYSSSYKRMFIVGNFIVSFLMGLVPFMVALFENRFLAVEYKTSPDLSYLMNENMMQILGFSLMAFGWTFMIEVIKDLATQKGDRELECHTLPIVFGEQKTKWILYIWNTFICLIFAYIIYKTPMLQNSLSYRFYICGTIIPALSLFYIINKAVNAGDYRLIVRYLLVIFAINIAYSYVIYSYYQSI